MSQPANYELLVARRRAAMAALLNTFLGTVASDVSDLII
jgi:hypothetical protein